MHMADALISPVVGGTMWAAAAGALALCSGRLKRNLDERRIPLMGVLGAFVFAAQMINFTIPGTGSSGHLGGGMLLAVLLGPAAGFVTMASVLTVQALFFADGGLLALGGNIINLGAVTCFLAYPLLFRPLAGKNPGRLRLSLACLVAAVFGLQLGSFGVVAETALSGVADLPFASFLLLMQPIHLLIGLVEGLVTAALVGFLRRVRPDALVWNSTAAVQDGRCGRPVLVPLLVAALLCGGLLSGFASTRPDGLEWALEKAALRAASAGPQATSSPSVFAALQTQTALLPGYDFPQRVAPGSAGEQPAPHVGTSLSGLLGGLLTLLLIVLGGGLTRWWQRLGRC
jgi:cobalt/nickel transport system permease protein